MSGRFTLVLKIRYYNRITSYVLPHVAIKYIIVASQLLHILAHHLWYQKNMRVLGKYEEILHEGFENQNLQEDKENDCQWIAS